MRSLSESLSRIADRSFRARIWRALCLALPLTLVAAHAAEAPAPAAAQPSATGEAVRLARMQGTAETAILDWVLANSGPLKGDARAGSYRVVFTITPAEGWWENGGGETLVWHDAPANHAHLRIFVQDQNDGRPVNNLILTATLIDNNGNEQPAPIAFGWYPLINAYGGNVPINSDGSYRLRVMLVARPVRTDPPAAGDEPEARTERPARITMVEFPAVEIKLSELAQQPLATQTAVANEAKLLKPANDAFASALTALWQHSEAGADEPRGDYYVAYALGESEASGALSLLRKKGILASKENLPLEVLVRDSRTGRPIPMLRPHARLLAAKGSPIDGGELAPVRRPALDVYGRMLHNPRKGSYTLRVWFDAPGFRRWGRQSERFAQPAELQFTDISLKPDRKPESKKNP